MSNLAGAVKAGRAYVEIFADASRMRDNLKEVVGDLNRFRATAANVGRNIVDPFRKLTGGDSTSLDSTQARLHRAIQKHAERTERETAAKAAAHKAKFAAIQRKIDRDILRSRERLNAELRRNYEQDRRAFERAAMAKKRADERARNAMRQQLSNASWSTAVVGGTSMAAGMAGGSMLGGSLKAAADAQAAERRFNAGFKGNAPASLKWAKQFAAAMHMSEAAVVNAMGRFRQMFAGAGFSQDEAIAKSKELTSTLADFTAFNQLSDQEGSLAFIGLLEGEAERLDQYGINAKEAELNQELLAQGFPKIAAGATEEQKQLARLAIVRRSMKESGAEGMGGDISTMPGVMRALVAEWENLKVAIGSALGEALLPFGQQLVHVIVGVRKFIEENKGIVELAAYVAAGAVAFGALLLGIYAASHAFSLFAVAWKLGWSAGAMVMNPYVLAFAAIAAAVAGVVYLFTRFTETGRQMAADAASSWGMVKKTAMDALGGIWEALKRGDIQAAWNVVTAGLKLAWASLWHSVTSIWIGFRGMMTSTMIRLVGGLVAIWEMLGYGMEAAWRRTEGAVLSLVQGFAHGITDAFVGIQHGVAEYVVLAQGTMEGLSESEINDRLQTLHEDQQRRIDGIKSRMKVAMDNPIKDRARSNEATLEKAWQKATAAAQVYQDALKVAEENTGMEMAEKSKELERLRRELDAAIQAARTAPDAVKKPDVNGTNNSAGAKSLGGDTKSIFGTFNPFGLRGFAGSTSLNRIATNTKATVTATNEVATEVRKLAGGLAFA